MQNPPHTITPVGPGAGQTGNYWEGNRFVIPGSEHTLAGLLAAPQEQPMFRQNTFPQFDLTGLRGLLGNIQPVRTSHIPQITGGLLQPTMAMYR